MLNNESLGLIAATCMSLDEAWWYYSHRDDVRTMDCSSRVTLPLAVQNPAVPNHRPVARDTAFDPSQDVTEYTGPFLGACAHTQ